MNLATPPEPDEFEISVIGPGRGECVVLHLGNNDWCIIDSCSARGRRDRSQSIAIPYLNGLGIGALQRVRLVVATHWHDDHIRGLASILRSVPDAIFACSAAIRGDTFLELIGAAPENLQRGSGVEEFAAILDLIEENARSSQQRRAYSPVWAIQNRPLLSLPADSRPFTASITALSPSDNTLTLAYREIGQFLPETGQAPLRIPTISENHTSVALWVQVGPLKALLGADLLHTAHPGEGWNAVIACDPMLKGAHFFKIPHHGSEGADCPEVWKQMLAANPISVVTPFSSVPLPKPSDLQRLLTRTNQLYCTAQGTGKAPPRDAVVEKMMRRQTSDRRVIEGRPGHVRVRWSISKPTEGPKIELLDPAFKVTSSELAA